MHEHERMMARDRMPRTVVFEEYVPSSGWTEDSDSYCLIIDLPGFKKDAVKLEVDNYGHLIVCGEKQVDEMKHVRFQESYKVPENSNIDDTDANFEDEILYLVIPKKKTETIGTERTVISEAAGNHHQEEEQNGENGNGLDRTELFDTDTAEFHGDNNSRTEEELEGLGEVDEYHATTELFDDAKMANEWIESSLLGSLKVQVMKNKGVFITAILAFSLGVLVSQKLQANQAD